MKVIDPIHCFQIMIFKIYHKVSPVYVDRWFT